MQIRSKISLLAGSVILLFGCTTPQQPESAEATAEVVAPTLQEAWRLETGLDRPESAIYDAERAVIYVTNLVGAGDAMDGIGYIAKVSPTGEMLVQDWITGLNAPKGIALGEDRLWASDINALVEIDLNAGEIVQRHEVSGDAYLNDVTVHPDGSIFVTDSRFSKIYRFANGTLSVWLENDQIQMPNGAHVIGEELVVAAGDGTTDNPGTARYFQAISFADQAIRTLDASAPDGALDAVEPDEKGGVFTTDWASGRLMYFHEGSGSTLLQQLGQGAADVDYIAADRMLYVPVMQEGQLIAYHVE
ncbi:MAG: hypothetical protein AAF564_04190 [Bacteroidota bacterium]